MKISSVLFLYFLAAFLQAGTYGLTFLLPPLFEAFGADEKDVGTVLVSTAISTLVTVLYLGHITLYFCLGGQMRTDPCCLSLVLCWVQAGVCFMC